MKGTRDPCSGWPQRLLELCYQTPPRFSCNVKRFPWTENPQNIGTTFLFFFITNFFADLQDAILLFSRRLNLVVNKVQTHVKGLKVLRKQSLMSAGLSPEVDFPRIYFAESYSDDVNKS